MTVTTGSCNQRRRQVVTEHLTVAEIVTETLAENVTVSVNDS